MKIRRESTLEKYGTEVAEMNGWFHDKIMKTSRGGFPDRFYAHPDRGVVLVEYKDQNNDDGLQANQEKRIKELRQHGVVVHVISTREQIHAIFI